MRGDAITDLSDTQYKLAEAEFFLAQLKRNHGKFNKFNFYLSAFISAARSVYWIMVREYKDVPGWNEWNREKGRTASAEVQDLLRRTTKMRNYTQKVGPIMAEIVTKIGLPKMEITRLNKLGPGRIMLQGTMQNCRVIHLNSAGEMVIFQMVTLKKFGRVEPKFFPHKDTLEECNKYYNLLAEIVKECTDRFKIPDQ
ncbi:conserved protein of unknown function [Nitrospira japonica]|uniref:Uncharacterized protein n=1 Tax=Nitrospira japonica TaxID=1325564 RepID=A0A1W1I8R2_9BACT|nr:hypothetical protein [Nitrospira japonica]SLM49311.1 conserved protein of unknown function [Nitrospira japonica]